MMRQHLLVLCMLLGVAGAAVGQVGYGAPGISIGITVSSYPHMVRVPGYPVYYAPGLRSNYFFYDGLYWVYLDDNWYVSSWYNGPWDLVAPDFVPLFLLRVPVRYYRAPPPYFLEWRRDAPPRWHEHWGPRWAERHNGWDRWNRHAVPAPAPLPGYQRQYGGRSYPPAERGHQLATQNYRYQPRDPIVQQRFPQAPSAPPPRPRGAPQERNPAHAGRDMRQQERQGIMRGEPSPQRDAYVQRPPPRPVAVQPLQRPAPPLQRGAAPAVRGHENHGRAKGSEHGGAERGPQREHGKE